MVGVKTAVSSAGAALAGLTIGVGPRPLLIVAAIVLSVSVVALTADRRVSPPTTEGDPRLDSTYSTP
jgi:hypothetical protein